MLLNELFSAKKLQQLPPDELVKQLQDAGFFKKVLGRGNKGIAFELNDGSVLKAWVEDPAYEGWINFAAKHPNPCYVKVLSKIKQFKSGDVTFKYVRLEKIDELSGHHGEIGWPAGKVKFLDDFLLDLGGYLNDAYPPFDKALQILQNELNIDHPNLKLLEFTAAVIKIAEEFRGEGFVFDLHELNLGMRGSQLVIIDPIHADEDKFKTVELRKVLGNVAE